MGRKTNFLKYVILGLLAIVIASGAYYLFDKYGFAKLSPLDAIPASTSAFMVIDGPGKFISDLAEDNAIWHEVLATEPAGSFLKKLNKADSILDKSTFDEWFEKGRLFVCFTEDSSGSGGVLLIFEWPYGASESDVESLFSDITGHSLVGERKDFAGIPAYMLSDSLGPLAFYMIRKGLCVIANHEAAMRDCALRITSKEPLPGYSEFEKVAATAGRNVDANIYINFRKIKSLSGNLLKEAPGHGGSILSEFASWSEIDLLIKNDEILLNGYTEVVDSLNQYLDMFRGQSPQKIEITRILPYNTSLLLNFGFDDFSELYKSQNYFYRHEGVFDDRGSRLETLKRQLGPSLEDHMTSWVGNEIALAMINPHLNDPASNSFVAIHARDIEMAVRRLKDLSQSSYYTDYRGYGIRRINANGLLPVFFGQVFATVDNNYYTRIEDYIVFANSRSSLENFINILLSGKTLEQNENFKSFTDNVSDRSNLFCYFNIRNSVSVLEGAMLPPIAEYISNNNELVKNFEAFAIQFKQLNDMYFTSAYIKYNPSYIKEDLSIWKTYLDAPVFGNPYFVKDHRTKNLKIVAFDTLNNMYLINHDGDIDWKINIGEKVLGDVHTVDYYKNGKIQYLFNTSEKIYLIDLLGRDVEGYPVELKKTATNGLEVFDYDNNKDYRIMLAMDDNRVYNFDIKGDKVRGWKNPLSKARVFRPVQHLRVGQKDYILIADEENNIKITDRKGAARINLKSKFENGLRSAFYVNETNNKGIILTTDNNGKLTYIKANGRIETTDFGSFSEDHYFLYEDFDNRGGKDFIYLDGNKLTVFDRFKNEMFSHEFENEINSSPVIIPVSATEKLIGVVSEISGKIYLFDRQGRLLSTPDHVGKTRMLIGSLNRDGQLNMISGSGNTIYNYYFR